MTDVIPISCYLNFHLRVKDKMWRSFASSVERKEMKERPKNRPKIRCRQFPCSWTFSECPFPLPPSTHYYYHSLSALLCLSDCESASGCEIAGVYMGCSKRTAKERPPGSGAWVWALQALRWIKSYRRRWVACIWPEGTKTWIAWRLPCKAVGDQIRDGKEVVGGTESAILMTVRCSIRV